MSPGCSILYDLRICKQSETLSFISTYSTSRFLFLWLLPPTGVFGHAAELVALGLAVELVGVGLAVARLVGDTQAGRGVEGPDGRLAGAGMRLHGQAAHGWGREGASTSCHLQPATCHLPPAAFQRCVIFGAFGVELKENKSVFVFLPIE